jgi:3-hydroxyacyl-CoA dehydrogenase
MRGAVLRKEGSVAHVTLSHPPLNTLSRDVRAGLVACIREAESDASVSMLVLRGEGGNFSAGADIKEMAGEEVGAEPTLTTVVEVMDSCSKPIVAAVEGVALGGGCEVALACDYRVASASARLGLPEVKIGLIPGAGGTQRLPRLTSVRTALNMVTRGGMVGSTVALKEGLVDKVVPKGEDILTAAVRHVQSSGLRLRKLSGMPTRDGPAVVEALCVDSLAKVGMPVQGKEPVWAAIEALQASAKGSFIQGMAVESRLFGNLIQSQQSRARRHLFFAERACGRAPAGAAKAPQNLIEVVGVVGAGTMGSGIAIAHLMAGYRVVLVDANADALQRGASLIKGSIDRAVKRGTLKADAGRVVLSRLEVAGSIDSLRAVGMVVEAVFENLELKKKIFRQLDSTCPPSAILCTNTSTLDVQAIAQATARPRSVMGMHFFSPAHVMPLVELVRAPETSPDTVAAVLGVVKRMRGKVGVVVGNCDGFVGNRMLNPYQAETGYLLEEGASPRQIDAAVKKFGFSIGPFEMADIAGIDIMWLIRKERGLLDPSKRDPAVRFSDLGDKLYEMGRYGQKAGKGWYRYQKGDRTPLDDPEVLALLEKHRAANGITPREISEDEILDRCFLPLINEGFKILQEGISDKPGDVDVIWANGYAWPRWRGGPMFYADEMGLSFVRDQLLKYGSIHTNVPHWQPADLLTRLVAAGHNSVSQYYSTRNIRRSSKL